MRDHISAILRLQIDHSQILQTLVDSLAALEGLMTEEISAKDSILDAEKLKNFEGYMSLISENLNEHMWFEEHEVLPTIITYAAEIINRGLLYEHNEIRQAIVELTEKANELLGAQSNHKALVAADAVIRQRLQVIHRMVENHASKQETIFELAHLARESMEMEDRYKPKAQDEPHI